MVRDPHAVPVTFVADQDGCAELDRALRAARNIAIDTEVPIAGDKVGELRVASVATRDHDGTERAWVIDARDVDPRKLAPVFDGVTAAAWNASFDARVIDHAVFGTDDATHGLTWWDAQLADALLHQGRSGFTWYHGLAWATAHYLGFEAEGKGTVQLSYTAHDDLSDEQIAYAAADAVETLWVADALWVEIRAAGLEQVCALEMAARPFLDRMERAGLPFDWPGWRTELDRMEHQHRTVVGRIAELTGGGQGNLFDDVTEPSWNPASDQQTRQALNRFSAAEVERWTTNRFGEARPLTDDDSVNASVLREIGGALCEALLEFREHAKILSTYGESIAEHLHDDGRMRPQYLQVVGTNTGRLASRNPNAQNFTPRMKPFVRPPDDQRVFVHADLSQAELRVLAHVAEDGPLIEAFARGEDVHVSTAASMFGVDPARLERDDPARLASLRQIAKALNFGIAYGTGAESLAGSLTANGTPTTLEEGRNLLAQYRRTYPGTAAWATERIAEIEDLSRTTGSIDWPATLRLARGFHSIAPIRREFRRVNHRWPTAAELAETVPDVRSGSTTAVEEIAWLLRFSAPVALVADEEPFTFASRTLAGRRQQFNLHLDRLFLYTIEMAIESADAPLQAVRSQFEQRHDLDLRPTAGHSSRRMLERQLEDRRLRLRFVEMLVAEAGREVAEDLLGRSARERVRAMVNAWRNAPIQGAVADIMLDAYARLHGALRAWPSARPVQTVHDSVVIECDRSDAAAIARMVRESLESASLRFCPSVRPQADVDVRGSLAEADVIGAPG